MPPLPAQDPPAVALHATETHTLTPPGWEGDIQLRVAHPVAGFAGGPPPRPQGVLYLLDGDLYFGTATEMTRLLAQFMGELPPLLVVGIGYGTPDPALQGELRTRDYTPTAVAEYEEMMARMGREPTLPPGRRMGGADAFLQVLDSEVLPYVEARWPVADAPATLFGSSMGGLLGTWGLLTRPGLFDGWILTSPSLWWDDGLTLAREREAAEAGRPLRGRVYLAAGALEEGTGVPTLDTYRLVTNTRLLAERLGGRGDPDLEVTLEIIPGETHTSVVPAALLRGLRALHPRPRRPGGP